MTPLAFFMTDYEDDDDAPRIDVFYCPLCYPPTTMHIMKVESSLILRSSAAIVYRCRSCGLECQKEFDVR